MTCPANVCVCVCVKYKYISGCTFFSINTTSHECSFFFFYSIFDIPRPPYRCIYFYNVRIEVNAVLSLWLSLSVHLQAQCTCKRNAAECRSIIFYLFMYTYIYIMLCVSYMKIYHQQSICAHVTFVCMAGRSRSVLVYHRCCRTATARALHRTIYKNRDLFIQFKIYICSASSRSFARALVFMRSDRTKKKMAVQSHIFNVPARALYKYSYILFILKYSCGQIILHSGRKFSDSFED